MGQPVKQWAIHPNDPLLCPGKESAPRWLPLTGSEMHYKMAMHIQDIDAKLASFVYFSTFLKGKTLKSESPNSFLKEI